MTTPRKIRTNQENAQKAKGPITARGKVAASKNSLKHGLLSKELRVPEVLKPEFDDLRNRLLTELKPAGVLQEFFFEEIVTCIWKLKLLLRFEMSHFNGSSDEELRSLPSDSELEEISGRRDFKLKFEFLEGLKAEVRKVGTTALKGHHRAPIVELFGEEFYKDLTEWDTTGVFELRMSQLLRSKTQLFGWRAKSNVVDQQDGHSNSPESIGTIDDGRSSRSQEQSRVPDQEPESITARILQEIESEADASTASGPAPRVDSLERADMICKLIAERQGRLQELNRLRNADAVHVRETLGARVDLQIRYSSAVKKDLKRAILQFFDLKSPL